MKPLSCPIGIASIVLLAAGSARAQVLPVLDADRTQLITQEVSGDAAYEHIRYMTQFHRPDGGSDGLWAVAEYMAEKARSFGLTDVQLIKQPFSERPWNASFADLWIVEPAPERLAGTVQSVLHLADNSRPADVTGELIDLGAGEPADFEGKDLRGRVVLTYGSLYSAGRRALCEGGALGVIWYPSPFSPDVGTSGAGLSRPDQLRWISLPKDDPEGCTLTWAFNLSTRQGVALANRLRQADAPITVHAVVRSAFDSKQGTEPWQVMVEGFIRGTEPGLAQDVVLTGHLQEEGYSANDDASGSASTLEVARALNRLIAEGKLPRPRRTIRFWWVNEISSQRQYFADHPDAHRSMWVNVNQDMVGADQSQDVMRKQNVTRLPATRFHFFNDVVESVIDYMVAGNTYELAQAQAGSLLYPKPHLAHLGTMHRYNADMIFFHTSSDHMTFLEAPIGVPGVSFTNMPDRYIHSSDDDLWNIDRTQLGRSAAAVALIAYAMADAGPDDVRPFAAVTLGKGFERMGANLRLALTWLAGSKDVDAAYARASDQIWYATERERLAVASLRQIAPEGADVADRFGRELERRHAQMQREIDLAYREATGLRPPPPPVQSDVERVLAALRPVLVAGPKEFLERRGVESPDGLHGLMAFEIMNAVNGERTGLDIYRYVAAEAREAGDYYYGSVSPAMVRQYLENMVQAGLVEVR
jgi:hypothetical protein